MQGASCTLGADNGNRTHLRGLGSRRSADELYPHCALPEFHRGTAYHRKDLRATLSTGPLICVIFLAVIYLPSVALDTPHG